MAKRDVPARLPPYTIRRTRGGRTVYYFQVPPGRKLTVQGETWPAGTPCLGDDVNAAIERGWQLYRQYEAERERQRREGEAQRERPGTVPHLLRKYRQSARYKDLAQRTRADYERYLQKIEAWSAAAGDPHVSTLRPKVIRQFVESFNGFDGKRLAWNALHLLFAQAVEEEEIERSPLESMTPPRRPKAQKGERRDAPTVAAHKAVVDQAISEGRWSIALALTFAYELAQRQEDSLRWERSWEQTIEGVPCVVFRQSKTNARMVLPMTEGLREMIRRAQAAGAVQHTRWRVVNEHTGRPFDERQDYSNSTFNHTVQRIARRAGVTGFKPGMRRHLGVIEMARAGLSIPQIASRTGHSPATAADIIARYMPDQERIALEATLQLEEYRRGER
jgi:integrase